MKRLDRLHKLALWHQISSASFLGPVRFRALWQRLGDDIERVFQMPDEELLRLKGAVTKQNIKGIREQAARFDQSLEFMQRQLSLAEACGGRILTLDDPDYPEPLRKSKMCHALLYCIGRVTEFVRYEKALAIVGTRNAAEESLGVAYRTAHELATRGWVIVSGMAKGIDSAAHEGALAARGRTIAVMGCGPDFVYPPEARSLYEQVKSRGLILSEFPFGTRPEDWKLKKRNKTTVALSLSAFIVETGAKGGTMNAAKACREQGKRALVLLPTWPCDQSGNVKAIEDGGVPASPSPTLPSIIAAHLASAERPDKASDIGALLGQDSHASHTRELDPRRYGDDFKLNDRSVRIRVYIMHEAPAVYRVTGEKRSRSVSGWKRVYEKGHVSEHRHAPSEHDALLKDWVRQAKAELEARTKKPSRRLKDESRNRLGARKKGPISESDSTG